MLEQVIGVRRSGGTFPDGAIVAARIATLLNAPAAAAPSDASNPSHGAAPHGAATRWRCTFVPSAELVGRGIRVDTVRERLASSGQILDAVPRVTANGSIAFDFVLAAELDADVAASWAADGIEVERVEAEAASPAAPFPADPAEADRTSSGAAATSHFVRVDLARLDELMRNVGDLVISRARLADTLSRAEAHIPAGEWRAVQENAIAIDRQLRTLREGIMRVRLVPVGEIFRRMPFVVRDLARETGKRVRMDLQGQSTEIDKFLIERMMDPVLHLVRNAVSHGIETVDERVAAGKRPEGTIVLSAATAGDIVRIDIADDGRGVDPDAVIARARAAGLALPPGPPDAATLLSLLCAPGFSTRDESDRASGRGVGMSVVLAAVEELSGTLRLETEKGTGTRFVIELPVTLAITDALIATVAGETFAVPQGAVREVVEVAGGRAAAGGTQRDDAVSRRGAAGDAPLAAVRAARQRARSAASVRGRRRRRGGRHCGRSDRRSARDRGAGDCRFAGQGRWHLRRHRPRRRTCRADSRPRDAGAADARASGSADQRRERSDRMTAAGATRGIGSYILFGVAGTTYALPSGEVRHMEMIENITRVPNAPGFIDGVVFSRGQVVPVVNLRARFGFERTPFDLRSRLIVVQSGARLIGLAADTAREFVSIPPDAIQPPNDALTGMSGRYVEGIASMGDRLVLILSLDRILNFAEAQTLGLAD